MSLYNLPKLTTEQLQDVACYVPACFTEKLDVIREWPQEPSLELYQKVALKYRELIITTAIEETVTTHRETFPMDDTKKTADLFRELTKIDDFSFDENIFLVVVNDGQPELRFFENPVEFAKFSIYETKREIQRRLNALETPIVDEAITTIEAQQKPLKMSAIWLEKKHKFGHRINSMEDIEDIFKILPDFWKTTARELLTERGVLRSPGNEVLVSSKIYHQVNEMFEDWKQKQLAEKTTEETPKPEKKPLRTLKRKEKMG